MSQQGTVADIEQRFRAMLKASRSEPAPTAAERKAQLRALRDMIAASSEEFARSIEQDYGCRSRDETLMAEVVPALTLVRDA